jgi:hypothetical protein
MPSQQGHSKLYIYRKWILSNVVASVTPPVPLSQSSYSCEQQLSAPVRSTDTGPQKMFFTPFMSLPESKNISNVLTSLHLPQLCLTLRISHKTFSSITFHPKRKFSYLTNTAVCYTTFQAAILPHSLLPLTTSAKVTRVLWVQRPDTLPTKIIYRPPSI